MAKAELPWIDLETTGLNAESEVILEIGIALTDKWGTVIDSDSWVVHDSGWDGVIEAADPYVKEMHKKSGLFDSIAAGVALEMNDAEVAVLDFLDAHEVKHGELPMCGSSVGFDRSFLFTHMPTLHNNFHYRNIDVSTIKELCRRLSPDLFARLPEKRELHRALPDLDETLAEYKFYLENFLFIGDELY